MIDLSHANGSKQHRRQIEVGSDVAKQIAAGDQRVVGVMIESHLRGAAGHRGRAPLAWGVSVTDACISFQQTGPLLSELADAVRRRRAGK